MCKREFRSKACKAERRVDDLPYRRGVLVEVLRVGVDGTDKEINVRLEQPRRIFGCLS